MEETHGLTSGIYASLKAKVIETLTKSAKNMRPSYIGPGIL